MPTAKTIDEIKRHLFVKMRNGILVFGIQLDIFKKMFFLFFIHSEKKYLVMNKAVNIEDTMPTIKVIANPLIGPE